MKSRGRPRKFDLDTALQQAMHVFWQKGFSATSLDDLGDAMGMNRPSIYNAFGNKEAIYRQSLATFCGKLDDGIRTCLSEQIDLRKGLDDFFAKALDLYCMTQPSPGCLMICTAPAEALNNSAVREDLLSLIKRVDKVLEENVSAAIGNKQIADDTNPRLLAMHIQSTLHAIALRARAGEAKNGLKKYAKFAVSQLPWTEN